ncbi:cytochrome b5 domain-containing protein 1 isoform X1 [Nilaparvata lugens]|uniref:cytochrome b5 domain-containing protein 1 isoform X2 n=1 Tax=Nilaparvata lugens TaxID=108931 RepID=UPI00193D06EA|nr:cytochrome b5 domain-containing protein 1 isoform X2 [Nilaparvata lugens]XP_039296970.1 cytochrome b5 domain-containing protein 1 isoform X1 [Nilaparvata lugens]
MSGEIKNPPKTISPFLKYIETPSLQDLRTKVVENKKLPFVMVRDVVLHNKPDDCWVIIFGLVRDLTPLIEEYQNSPEGKDMVKPILAFAGKDISHWFDARTGDMKRHVHPITGALVQWTPHGRIPHVGIETAGTDWTPPPRLPWWMDSRYVVARLTAQERQIRILNMLTGLEAQLCVCAEDTINQIQERYLQFNAHAHSYLWTYDRRPLQMDKTLQGNRIYDERQTFEDLEMPATFYVPCLMLYFKDDLSQM